VRLSESPSHGLPIILYDIKIPWRCFIYGAGKGDYDQWKDIMSKKNALGKGLGAIFTDLMDNPADKPNFAMCGIEELSPNKFQPRKIFNGKEQRSLAASIKKNGILQPIVVRRIESGYEIIAGERRWRAAQIAGLMNVPIIIRHNAKDIDVAELSLVENIQREGLNPIEESEAYQTLTKIFAFPRMKYHCE